MRRGRNKRKRTDHGIELVEWEEYFKVTRGNRLKGEEIEKKS